MLSVFGPRDPSEVERVLQRDGVLIVVSPRPAHLRQIVAPLDLIGVDPAKDSREATAFVRFTALDDREITYSRVLQATDVVDVIAMGPSGAHLDAAELAARTARLTCPMQVTVSVRLRVYGTVP